ncbi:hypothetical protein BCR35DRAFT_336139 [Leucosporidium creatinivorum]|uniref:Uncharacterized protein n=1 Tax=Leucosporidium creatinivorum TaxID=106004 RepID=A0A1Y2CNW1_9BASI|nr:hypothetical protein BCR35DRAFT_336139 [Leucosporidium creatinivorum]
MLSPYNHSNPYYGYPAFVPSTSLDPSGIPRPHYHRRRKRDLVRTLTYLAVLRFLALHRSARAKLGGALQGVLKVLGLGRGEGGAERRKVHWDESGDVQGKQATSTTSSATPTRLALDQLLPLFLLFLLLRTPDLPSKLRFVLRAIFLRLPVRVLSALVDTLATVLARVRRVGGAGVGRTRKRDVLRRAVGEVGRKAVEWSEGGGVKGG